MSQRGITGGIPGERREETGVRAIRSKTPPIVLTSQKPMSTTPTNPTPMSVSEIEAMTGLEARYLPPIGEESVAGMVDFGNHFRYQLGRSVQEERFVVVDGRRIGMFVTLFHLHFYGSSWDSAFRKFLKGERASA